MLSGVLIFACQIAFKLLDVQFFIVVAKVGSKNPPIGSQPQVYEGTEKTL